MIEILKPLLFSFCNDCLIYFIAGFFQQVADIEFSIHTLDFPTAIFYRIRIHISRLKLGKSAIKLLLKPVRLKKYLVKGFFGFELQLDYFSAEFGCFDQDLAGIDEVHCLISEVRW